MVAACWLSDDSHEVFLLFLPLSWLAQKTCALPGWHVCLHAAGCTPSEAQAPVPSSTLFPLDLASLGISKQNRKEKRDDQVYDQDQEEKGIEQQL